ncbi:MAG: hypothetical protein JNL19_10360, partial [Burkholderiales bacterium]|nr:hypothetical protein [Burkholderiales bacterium]
TIRSNPITLGPTNLVSGEVNAGAANAGANGPNGDMFDVLTGDFGVFLPAKLGNLVWYDTNRNGRADSGEPGLNNVLVILTDGNGVEVARQYTRNNPTTGTPGYYTFDYLIPGNYYVTFFPVNDWLTTVPGTPSIVTGTGAEMNDSQPASGLQVGRSQTVTLAPGDNNPQLDAGFYAAEAIPTLAEAMRNLLALMLLVVGFAAMRRKAGGWR